MAIYLDNQTRPVLRRLLEKRLLESPKDFITERILKAVQADDARLEVLANCEHVKASYIGHKTCCGKCESFYEPGMGESWSLTKDSKREE